ncbi:hypothetical protein ACFV4G_43150 [Kitasatospora sp. NPDC059747]|uniref:hypothetical protein n=1 Tax=unclassified Kitasatospora TaxID=2633591 RepID=UPI003655293A
MTAAFEEFARRAYGSLDHPTYHRIGKLLEQDPYRPFRASLPSSWQVEDITDDNCDVGSVWRIGWAGGGAVLRLSVIGPYATAFALHPDGYETDRCLFPAPGAPAARASAAEPGTEVHRLAALTRAAGFALLSAPELARTVPLRLPDADGPVTLYEALFCFA